MKQRQAQQSGRASFGEGSLLGLAGEEPSVCREGEAGIKASPTAPMRTSGTAVVKQCGRMTFRLMTISSGVKILVLIRGV